LMTDLNFIYFIFTANSVTKKICPVTNYKSPRKITVLAARTI